MKILDADDIMGLIASPEIFRLPQESGNEKLKSGNENPRINLENNKSGNEKLKSGNEISGGCRLSYDIHRQEICLLEMNRNNSVVFPACNLHQCIHSTQSAEGCHFVF